eukprot:scaffold4643_cov174-Skeletonema_menzelii.AAC.5
MAKAVTRQRHYRNIRRSNKSIRCGRFAVVMGAVEIWKWTGKAGIRTPSPPFFIFYPSLSKNTG